MPNERLNVQYSAAKAVVLLLLCPLLLVLSDVGRETLLILSAGAAVQAIVFILLANRELGKFVYRVVTIMFFVGIATAIAIHFELGYKLERQYALIFSIPLVSIALDQYRACRDWSILPGFWAGMSFQLGLLTYSLVMNG